MEKETTTEENKIIRKYKTQSILYFIKEYLKDFIAEIKEFFKSLFKIRILAIVILVAGFFGIFGDNKFLMGLIVFLALVIYKAVLKYKTGFHTYKQRQEKGYAIKNRLGKKHRT